MKSRIVTAVVLGVLGSLLTACTSTNNSTLTASTAATTAPVTTAPADPLDTSADEAVAAYLAYVEAYNATANDKFRGWERLTAFTTGEESTEIQQVFSAVADAGGYQVGDSVVKNLRVVQYNPEPRGLEGATLQGCSDESAVQMVYPGRDTVRPGSYIVTVTMKRFALDNQGDAFTYPDPAGLGWWRTSHQWTDETRPCGSDGMER